MHRREVTRKKIGRETSIGSAASSKAWLKVDEEGTEAAAATAILMIAGAEMPEVEPRKPIPFHVDRPFVFLIRDDETGAVLFMGRIMDPTSQ